MMKKVTFRAKISKMGEGNKIIYIPRNYHNDIEGLDSVDVTLEAVE